MTTIESPTYIQTQLGIAITNGDDTAVERAMSMLADYVRSLNIPGATAVETDGGSITVHTGTESVGVHPAGPDEADASQIRILGRGYTVVLDHLEHLGAFLAAGAALAAR